MIPLNDLKLAVGYDSTLKFTESDEKLMSHKYLHPLDYSRNRLYDSMYSGKTVVFRNYPLKGVGSRNVIDKLVSMLYGGLPSRSKISIRAGASRTLHRVTIEETINRWIRGKSKFGVTDLHFRGTRFYNMVDANAISYFNLLPHMPKSVSFLEMLTLVISSKGIFSDSHSDDGDGSNHCFVGKKLWLAWDRNEGQKKGLEDCTFDPVYDQAKFSMKKFLSLKSAHWFIVSTGQTLFMPGNFTHKVVTLEPYIGFGSFYLSLPGYINALKRWTLFETGDVKGDFIKVMNRSGIKKIRTLLNSSSREREKWGMSYLKAASSNWQKGLSAQEIHKLHNNSEFNDFIEFANLTVD